MIMKRGTGAKVKIPIESMILRIRELNPENPPMKKMIPMISMRRKAAKTGIPVIKRKSNPPTRMNKMISQLIDLPG
jgi:hypothetical protein